MTALVLAANKTVNSKVGGTVVFLGAITLAIVATSLVTVRAAEIVVDGILLVAGFVVG
jgi:hypothetical protein